MSYRVLDDGSLVFPHRGKPPEEMPGYVRDPGDNYRFIPEVDACPFRKVVQYIRPCGKIGCRWLCDHLHREVNLLVCNSCEVNDDTP